MVIMYNLSVNGKACGSTPLLYQAVRAAVYSICRMERCAVCGYTKKFTLIGTENTGL